MTVHKAIDRKANRAAGVLVASWAWKTALGFLGLKLVQWLVLLIASLAGGWAGLPEIQLGAHIVAGCWVASSFVWLLMRKWTGAVSSMAYSCLSLIVAVGGLASGQLMLWNSLTTVTSLFIIVCTVVAVARGDFRHSRW